MFFDLGALNGLSMHQIYEIPIPAPIFVFLLRNLRPYRVEFVRLKDRLAQAALESYSSRSPPHPLVEMVQRVIGMLFLLGFDLVSKSSIDRRYTDFLSSVPQPFGLATLGYLVSIVLSVKAGVTCVTHFLLASFPYFPAKPEIIHQHWLTKM